MHIVVGKEETRFPKKYESCKYKVEISADVDDPNKVVATMNNLFALIREKIEAEKNLDGVSEQQRNGMQKRAAEAARAGLRKP